MNQLETLSIETLAELRDAVTGRSADRLPLGKRLQAQADRSAAWWTASPEGQGSSR
jgi:hypothetical protein